jgi:hypothetical protein
MKILALAPLYNSPGKNDATGAFQPEARAFVRLHGGAYSPIDNHASKAAMRADVMRQIVTERPGILALCCHGWRTGIQFGFGLANVAELAEAIAENDGTDAPRVVLYACSTADGSGPGGDGGFADRLRDALCAAGCVECQVDAHDRPGHTTKNPFVRRFVGAGSAVGGTGGQWIVAPKSTLWRRWVAALRGDLRLRFPLMTVAEIHEEVKL